MKYRLREVAYFPKIDLISLVRMDSSIPGDTSMRINVEKDGTQRSIEIDQGSNIINLIEEIGMHPDAIIVLKDRVPVPLTDMMEEGDSFEIIRVASGG